jgi:hypothetical protein
MRLRFSSTLWACALAALACLPRPAAADDALARAVSSSIAIPTASELRDIMAQAVPVGVPKRPLSTPGLPTGFTYTLDGSIAYPFGNPGYNAKLPGGMDAVVGYGFNKHFRVQAGYYEFQEYPTGFDSGIVPVYLQGFGPPIGTQDLSQAGVDVTTKDKLLILQAQSLFTIAHKLPIIISPTYISRSAKLGGTNDTRTFEVNGFPITGDLRTSQVWLLPVTLPFLSTPKMFGTITAAPEWNLSLTGANAAPNHAQIFELLYLEYRANKQTTFFIQPSRLIDYLPADPYPETIPTMLYGVSHKFTKNTFVQIVGSNGGPSNYKTLGISALTCQQITATGGCGNPVPTLNGLHAAQVQIQFGIGSPSVIPL